MQQFSDSVIVVGAGWSGLSAAFKLSQAGIKVLLLEAAPQAGGRAREITFGEESVDNGQHLLIGAYQHTLQLLKELNLKEDEILQRIPLELLSYDLSDINNIVHLKLPNRQPKWQFLSGILTATGLKFIEKLKAIQLGKNLLKLPFSSFEDISVHQWLTQLNQPESLIRKLWEPIALAALSTPIQKASATVFMKVMNNVFTEDPNNSNWLMTKTHLSQILPNPILKKLKEQGSIPLFHQRVQSLIIENGECKGVTTATETFRAKAVILATPPHVTARILNLIPTLAPSLETLKFKLSQFSYQPITTLYLQYKIPVQLPFPMIGLNNSLLHWVFDRKICQQPNLLSGVISGKSPHSDYNHKELVNEITNDLNKLFPYLTDSLINYRVITEKQAAFSCEVGVESYRPSPKSAIPNLWLAGDYTNTQLPSTLEGAIQSGIKAAQLILSTYVLRI